MPDVRSLVWAAITVALMACGEDAAVPSTTAEEKKDVAPPGGETTATPGAAGGTPNVDPPTKGATPAQDDSGGDPAVSPKRLVGWWVWSGEGKVVVAENGTKTVTRTRDVTDADMTWKVGPDGWPGCPQGISCTKTGIKVRGFVAGRFHVMNRVTTGSDFQDYGTLADTKPGILALGFEEGYSCAHPSATADAYKKPRARFARFFFQGDELWLREPSDAEPTEAGDFIVYRQITRDAAHDRYDHRFTKNEGVPHCLCPVNYGLPPDKLTSFACDGLPR